ncbi:ligand-binding sensor domain-containing protein [Pedobacter mendelii]|uniref:Sensor histidine kinase n=1 Tax=Pedobacter mendelii TaxID=1908240 RepID=A0ABQ2BPF2_9SPHI|nr:two-component regulator propeller domain-containing protein [Pedobacter mendelii]GGI29155.1 sensor histidine kinase [Pedobacter mendelii]
MLKRLRYFYKYVKLLLSLLLIFISHHNSFSQNKKTLLFKHLTQENGLSDPTIRALHIDKDDFLWIGTENGLNRFDGTNCITYKKTKYNRTNFPGNYITNIIEDKNGDLIIGSQSNLVKYNKKADSFSSFKFILPKLQKNYYSFPFYIDKDNKLWVYLAGEIYNYSCNNNQLKKITGFSNGFQFTPKLFYNELDWFVSRGVKGIYLNKIEAGKEKSASEFFMSSKKPNLISHVEDAYISSDTSIWLAGEKGIIKLNPVKNTYKIFSYYKTKPFIGTSIAKYPDKPWLLVGTNGSGLLLFDLITERFITQYKHLDGDPFSISANYIRRIYIDKKNNLFLGIDRYGLDYTNLNQVIFPRYITKAETIDNDISRILKLNDNQVWFGTKSSGLKIYNKDLSELLKSMFKGLGISKLIHLKNKDVLVEINNGSFYLYKTIKNKFYQLKVAFPNKFKGKIDIHQIVYCNGNLLAATEFGVAKVTFTERNEIFFDLINDVNRSLPWNNTQQIIQISNKELLIQTYYTAMYLYRFNNGKFNYIKEIGRTPYAINGNIILNGNLYLATTSGLLKFNTKNISFREEILIDANCSSITADKNKNLWVGTSNGLYFFDTNKNNSVKYTTSDGLQSMVFNPESIAMLKDDQVAIGGINGINLFNPNKTIPYKSSGCPKIVSIQINDKPYHKAGNSVTIKKLNLNHNENTITIGYSSMDYINPIQRKIKYKMIGYDNKEVTVMGNSELRFPNIPSGTYNFELTDLVSSNKIVMTIIINAPFWQKWWFIAIIIIGLILTGILMLILYLRWIKHLQALQIRQMITFQKEDRKRIADDLHDDLGLKLSSLKHYLLAGDINKMIQSGELRKLSAQYIDQALHVLRNTLINLSPKTLDENGLVFALHDLVDNINKLKIIKIHLDNVGFNTILKNTQQYALYRICQELINNSIKHAEAENIYISIVNRDNKVILLYEDDGKGFDYATIKRGYGLSNIEAHIQAIKADINIDTLPGRGLAATITINFKAKTKTLN